MWLIRSLILFFLTLPFSIFGQYYHSGQAPASMRWMQIKEKGVHLIFPKDHQSEAIQLLHSLDTLMPLVEAGLSHTTRRVPIILYNSGVVSNGLTAWAPRRMEFYTTPPQDNLAQDWISQLAIHEFRHAVQMDKLHTGMTKVLGWILGEQAIAAVLGLYIPMWFLEGDAVVAETALSKTGRGRDPSFSAPLRTQLDAFGMYSYEKAIFGSYRDNVPNAYILGYHLTSLGVKNFGPKSWQNALERTGKRPWSITPFSSGFKQVSGYSKDEWYRYAMHELDSMWRILDRTPSDSLVELLSGKPTSYTDYNNIWPAGNGLVVCEKFSIGDIDRIVAIDSSGAITTLATPGLLMRGSLSARNSQLLWAEYRYDPRWQHRSWTAIMHLDITTGIKRRFRLGESYFSPSLSPDLQEVMLVKATPTQVPSLVFLSLSDGVERAVWQDSSYIHLMQPAWHEDGVHIALIAQDSSGAKRLLLIDRRDGQSNTVYGPVFSSLQHPRPQGSGIWFTGDVAGEEAIIWVDTTTGVPSLMAAGRYGLAQANPDRSGNLFAIAYNPMGYRPVKLPGPLSPRHYAPATGGLQAVLAKAIEVDVSSNRRVEVKRVPDIRPYRRISNLFRFHSWAPAYIHAEGRSFGPGFSIMSQDLLNTSFLTAGYQYNYNEGFGVWEMQYRYEGWYPKLSVVGSLAQRTGQSRAEDGTLISYGFQEKQLETGMSLPLQWIVGKYWVGIFPRVNASWLWLQMDQESPLRFRRDEFNTLDYSIFAYRLHKQSTRDIQPPWGQTLELRYRHSPFFPEAGDIRAALVTCYFPGMLAHHGLRLVAAVQHRKWGEYYYPGFVRYPAGFQSLMERELLSLSFMYRFPLWLPDANIPALVYLKRVKAGLFVDWAQGRNHAVNNIYRSAGAELRFDTHLLRFIAPVDVGYRFIRDLDRMRWSGEFLLSINFSDL